MKLKDLSIVIPVYQAESSIGELIDQLENNPFLKTLKWELILVDDCSSDTSFQIIEAKSKHYSNITGLTLHKNSGQHSATLAGIIEAKGELLLTMDDDFEHPVEEIEGLISAINNQNADVAFGIPKNQEKNFVRKRISKEFKRYTRSFSEGYGEGSAFRLMRKEIYTQLSKHKTPFVFIDEVLAWYTKNAIFISIDFNQATKKSTYRISNLFGLYFNIMFTYSSFPAQLLTKVGILGSFISFGVGVFYIIKKLFFKAQLGFTSIAVSILFSVSLILLALGVIAQYIYRQNRLLNQYPQFSIKSRTDEED
jgi:undecaprenyl-phosphate 4-deoxy-4-formamido-L-arabinose transferase